MSDIQVAVKVKRIIAQSGYEKNDNLLCPIMKILQMRHKDLDKTQALRIAKSILG